MIDWVAHHAGLIGLLFFFLFFTGTAAWVFRPGARDSYMDKARIPLKEDGYEQR